MNTWPNSERRAMTQSEHEAWNAENYPGTLQLCTICDQPTGRCEEDALTTEDGLPLCPSCWDDASAGDELTRDELARKANE